MLAACDKFTDVHQEFIKGGEIIYAPKLDSVGVVAGKNRVGLALRYLNGHHLKSTVVYWNDAQDSLVVDLAPFALKSGLDSLETVVPDLPENSYSLYLQNVDQNGSRSLLYPAYGTSYGADFQALIGNRRIREIWRSDEGFGITWLAADESMVGVELKFTDAQTGEERLVRKPVETESVISFMAKDNRFSYRSLHIPEEAAIDTFYTEWSEPEVIPE